MRLFNVFRQITPAQKRAGYIMPGGTFVMFSGFEPPLSMLQKELAIGLLRLKEPKPIVRQVGGIKITLPAPVVNYWVTPANLSEKDRMAVLGLKDTAPDAKGRRSGKGAGNRRKKG